MLRKRRPDSGPRRRGASTAEYSLLLAAIATVVAMVAFAFGNYLHSTLRPGCDGSVDAQSSSSACTPAQH